MCSRAQDKLKIRLETPPHSNTGMWNTQGHTVIVVTHTFCVAGSFFLHSFRPVPWCWPLTTTEESKANHYVVTHKHGVGVDGCYCI